MKQNIDPIFAARDEVVHFFIENQRAVIAAIALVLIGILVWLGVAHFKESKIVEDNARFSDLASKQDVESLKKYISDHPGSLVLNRAVLDLANLYISQSKWNEAADLIVKYREDLPEFIRSNADWSHAQLLWQAGQIDEALSFLDTRIQDSTLIAKNKSMLELLKAQLLVATGKPEEASKIFEKLSKATEQDAWVLQNARAGWITLKLSGKS